MQHNTNIVFETQPPPDNRRGLLIILLTLSDLNIFWINRNAAGVVWSRLYGYYKMRIFHSVAVAAAISCNTYVRIVKYRQVNI